MDATSSPHKVDLPDGTVVAYVIDPDQRRVGKKINGILVTQWLYADDLRIVAELDGSGNVTSRFVWADGTGSDEDEVRAVLTRLGLRDATLVDQLDKTTRKSPLFGPAYMLRGGDLYRIVTGRSGGPRLVTNVSTGAVAERVDTDEWGNVLSDSSPGFSPFGFAGGLSDGDTDLVRFGARDYDALTGRWTSRDPIHDRNGNYFIYAGSDPINRTDSPGTFSLVPCALTFAFCSGFAIGTQLGGLIDGLIQCSQQVNNARRKIDQCDPLNSKDANLARAEAFWDCVGNFVGLNAVGALDKACTLAVAAACIAPVAGPAAAGVP